MTLKHGAMDYIGFQKAFYESHRISKTHLGSHDSVDHGASSYCLSHKSGQA